MLLPAACKHDLLSQLQPTWWQYTDKKLQSLEEVNLMSRQFDVLVERHSEGFFVATVPALPRLPYTSQIPGSINAANQGSH